MSDQILSILPLQLVSLFTSVCSRPEGRNSCGKIINNVLVVEIQRSMEKKCFSQTLI